MLSGDDAIVLCEGNYLRLSESSTARKLAAAARFDESWFVRPAARRAGARDRVVERCSGDGVDLAEKTLLPPFGRRTRARAEKRADANDALPNAHLVDRSVVVLRLWRRKFE